MTTRTVAAALLIGGGRVITPDGDPHHPAVADVLVVDYVVAAVGPDLSGAAASYPDRANSTLETSRLLALPPQYPGGRARISRCAPCSARSNASSPG